MRAHFFTRRSPSEPWTPEWRGSRYLPAQSCAPIAQERAALLRPGSLLPRGPVAIIRYVPASPPDAARDRPVALLVLLRVEGSHDPPILVGASRAAPLAVACSLGCPPPKKKPVFTLGWTLPAVLPAEAASLRGRREMMMRTLLALIPPHQQRDGGGLPMSSPLPPHGVLPRRLALPLPPGAELRFR